MVQALGSVISNVHSAMTDLEKVNSISVDIPRSSERDENCDRREELAKFAAADNLSLRDSDETTIEPVITRHTHASALSRGLSRMSSKKTYVDFEHGDPENPLNFSTARKWFITILAVMMTILVAAAAGAYAPVMPHLIEEFDVSSEVATLGISLYPLGFGIGPLFLAPLSEIQGRNPVYYITFFITAMLFIPQAMCKNIQTILISRFFSGLSASVGATMVGGTISDIFETKDRGTPMNLFGVGSLTGTGLGPFVAGFIYSNSKLGWRWIFWIQLIINLVWLVVIILFLPETRGSVILRRRVNKLKKQTGDLTLVAVGDESRLPLARLMKISTTRPLMLLFTEHIVFWFSVWVSFTWGILYLFLNTISQVFRQSHNFNTMQVGLAFLGMILGGIIGFATSPIQDFLYSRASKRNNGKPRPEARLYFSCVGSLMFSSGLFWFGWSSGPGVHWIVPILGVGWTIIGIYAVYTAVFNYLADSYTIYASSALAAQSFMRNMFAVGFPMFSIQMNNRLGFNWSMSLLGFIGLALSATPFILMFYGPRIRERSRFSKKVLAVKRTK